MIGDVIAPLYFWGGGREAVAGKDEHENRTTY